MPFFSNFWHLLMNAVIYGFAMVVGDHAWAVNLPVLASKSLTFHAVFYDFDGIVLLLINFWQTSPVGPFCIFSLMVHSFEVVYCINPGR